MLKIKLFLRGKRNQHTYRVVVAEARSKRDGKFTDDLGWWDPKQNRWKVDKERLRSWQEKGAQLTVGVKKLIEQWKNY